MMTFDQYQRYATIAKICDHIREQNQIKKLNILEVGANAQKNLGRILVSDEIFYTDIEQPEGFENDDHFFVADATNLVGIDDNQYDVVVASDVFEHIPEALRKAFLTELNRVSKYGAIVCFPYDNKRIHEAEVQSNLYYKSLNGVDYIWLEEHIANGLPKLNQVYGFLDEKEIKYVEFKHGDVDVWLRLMNNHFYCTRVPELKEYQMTIDQYYIDEMYAEDVSECCYREFLWLCPKEQKDVNKKFIKELFGKAKHKKRKIANLDYMCQQLQLTGPMYINQRNNVDNSRDFVGIVDNNSIVANSYFDYGEGCKADSVQKVRLQEGVRDSKLRIRVPSNVVNVRFDPIEDKACIVKRLEVMNQDGQMLEYTSNGVHAGDGIYFDTTDPQIHIPCKGNVKEILIDIEFMAYNNTYVQNMVQNHLEQYKKYTDIVEIEQEKNKKLSNENRKLSKSVADYEVAYKQLHDQYVMMQQSTFWKCTKPFRVLADGIKRFGLFRIMYKTIRSLVKDGLSVTVRKIKDKFIKRDDNKRFAKSLHLSIQEKREQEETTFEHPVKFSVLVPLYNTPEKFLREMIESVQTQTYGNWELCLADGSDQEHQEVATICKQYASKDSRIVYKKLEKNLGISDNTNACMDMATGEYIALFDHDDVLHPAALYEVMKTIEEYDADYIYTDEATFDKKLDNIITLHFKPDFAIDNLRANNYICHFSVFSKELVEKSGKFDHRFDGSQDHDMILRLTENAKCVRHIPKVLYYWRFHQGSVSADINAKSYAIDAAKRAVSAHLERQGLVGKVESSRAFPTIFRITYEIKENPLISIIIPNSDHKEDLQRCIDSILEKSTYDNYEIIIVDNNSKTESIQYYYDEIKQNEKIRVIHWDREFNYSAINNYGVNEAKGDYVLLLNNDVEVIEPAWMEEMLMYAQRDDVGAVGAMLYYEDNTMQHAGVVVGMGEHGVAGHGHHRFPRGYIGYMGRLCYAHDVTAVTAACMLVDKKVYEEVNGFDEKFQVAYNDVDLCMKIRKAGNLVVFTPYAELYHYESLSRGNDESSEKRERLDKEAAMFHDKWGEQIVDPYYNQNLTLNRGDYTVK